MKWLIFFWLAYFFIHSALASLRVKHWFARCLPKRVRFYRMGFNLVSLILLLPIAWQLQHAPGATWWAWQGWQAWLANGLALAAIAGFFASLRHYDGRAFLGLRQLRSHGGPDPDPGAFDGSEAFRLSPFHRHVRHPWYAFSLVLIWTRDMNDAMLVSAILLTLYFAIGSWLEEKKLIAYHGDAYRRYRQRVPGLIPLPWKSLSVTEAAALVAEANKERPDARRFVAGDPRSGV